MSQPTLWYKKQQDQAKILDSNLPIIMSVTQDIKYPDVLICINSFQYYKYQWYVVEIVSGEQEKTNI